MLTKSIVRYYYVWIGECTQNVDRFLLPRPGFGWCPPTNKTSFFDFIVLLVLFDLFLLVCFLASVCGHIISFYQSRLRVFV